jgi:hypothetical protein
MIKGDVTKCPYCFHQLDPELLEEKINKVVYCDSCKQRCRVRLNAKHRLYVKKYPFKPKKPSQCELKAKKVEEDNAFLISLAKKCIMMHKKKKKFRQEDLDEFFLHCGRRQVIKMRDDFIFQATLMGYDAFQLLRFFEANNARKAIVYTRLKTKQYQ